MRKNIKLFVPFALTILIGSLTFAFAQSSRNDFGDSKSGDRQERRMPPPGFPPHGGGLNPRVLEQLNLTDAQKEQVKTIMDGSRDASKANFDKMRGFDEQLKMLVESGTFNEDQARQILTAKSQVMVELELNHLRSDAAILKILTADQKAQLEQLKAERPEPPSGGFRPENRPQN